MKKIVKAILLPSNNPGTIEIISEFLTLPHVFDNLQAKWRTLPGLFYLLKAVENGDIRVLAGIQEDGSVAGICFGELLNGGGWLNHSAFRLHVNAIEASLLIEKVLQAELQVKYIVGYIPDSNRQAKIYARRFGCKDMGLDMDKDFKTYDGKIVKCREFRKEL